AAARHRPRAGARPAPAGQLAVEPARPRRARRARRPAGRVLGRRLPRVRARLGRGGADGGVSADAPGIPTWSPHGNTGPVREAVARLVPARDALRLVALAAMLVLALVRWFGLLEQPPTATAIGFALGATAV